MREAGKRYDAAGRPAGARCGLASCWLCMHVYVSLVVVWAQPGFSGPVLLFGLNWFGV